jgi:hypothetical protein
MSIEKIFYNLVFLDSDRSKKLGFDEYIQSDPCKFDHHDLFKTLQTATLDYRLSDPYCSLVNINYFFSFIKNFEFKYRFLPVSLIASLIR